jgi:hypothetical protein
MTSVASVPRSVKLFNRVSSYYTEIFDGMDMSHITCLDIAQNISVHTLLYQNARRELDDALIDLGAEGPESWVNGSAEAQAVLVELEDAVVAIETSTLNMLAVNYNSYYCYQNNWQEAAPDYTVQFVSSLPGGWAWGDGGGGCGSTWGTVQESFDGGLSWLDLWSGYYTECQD